MPKILIIDDTVLIRQYLKKIIEIEFKDVEVIVASNGTVGIERVKLYDPDVITLDYEMPGMNGLECLREIVNITNAPVIMVSSYTTQGASITIEALNLGAFDFICKPRRDETDLYDDFEIALIQKVKAALSFRAKKRSIKDIYVSQKEIQEPKKDIIKTEQEFKIDRKINVVAIGISTGGPPVISRILSNLPENFKIPILIVQHMPAGFTREFAKRLDSISPLKVKEAEDKEVITPGTAYIAPGGKHMMAIGHPENAYLEVYTGERVSGHIPSADVLFSSVARTYGDKSLGIIMTGMGSDGSKGLLEMKKSGAETWGQREDTCVIYGMPKVANDIGATKEMLSIDEIISRLKQIGALKNISFSKRV